MNNQYIMTDSKFKKFTSTTIAAMEQKQICTNVDAVRSSRKIYYALSNATNLRLRENVNIFDAIDYLLLNHFSLHNLPMQVDQIQEGLQLQSQHKLKEGKV